MTHVSTIKTNTQTMTPEALQEAIRNGSIDSTKITDVSVFNQSADPSACSDGEDDGKIGFFDAIGSTIKGAVEGVVNGIKGCFFDENGNFSLGNTLKTALTVGACFIPGVGPVIATGLCAYGAVKGGIGVAKGVAAAATAETDAEAKAAFESIGANGVATAASAVGLKASASALASNVTGSATGSTLKNLGSVKDAVVKSVKTGNGVTGKLTSAADTLTGGYYGSSWSQATGTNIQKIGQVAQETIKDTGSNIYNAYNATKQAVQDKAAKLTGKKGTAANMEALKKQLGDSFDDIKGEGTYVSKDGKTQIEVKQLENGEFSYSKSSTKTTTNTTKYEVKDMDSLSKEVQEGIRKNNGTYYDEATGTTYELGDSNYGAQSNNVGVTSQAKTTTQTISAKKAASNLTDAQMAQLKDGRTVTVKGTSYKMNGDNVVMTQTKNVGKLEYQASNFAKNALESGYQGLSTTGGNVKMAAGTLASTKTDDAADEIEQQIPLASQTLATVDIQSGVEYDLEDYSIMDEDQVNKSYSTIMSNAYGL